jgi:type IV pilus assembly protein PilE
MRKEPSRAADQPQRARVAPSVRAYRGHQGGFTLIELMITVAVAGILAAVALPMYTVYVQRSKIAEAVSSLSDMRSRLEQYFFDNGRYPGACVAAGPGPAAAGTIYLPTNSQYFTVGCALPSATSYTVTATGTAT